MEHKNIIIILIAIIIVLSAIVGTMLLQPTNTKEPTEVKIISNSTLSEGDELVMQLAGLDGTAISKEKVDIVIVNKKGDVLVNKTAKTNSKGKAKIDLDLKKGKYDVNVTFGGNEIYNYDTATQILRINQKTTKIVSDENTANTNNYPNYNPSFGYYRSIEQQAELCLIETANGEYYVLAGDGYYTYDGHDSQGYIKLGSYVGKYWLDDYGKYFFKWVVWRKIIL